MAEPKTRPTGASVDDFLAGVAHAGRRADAADLRSMLEAATGRPAVMWGSSIVGFGQVVTATGVPWPAIGFSPRKAELVLYLHADVEPALFDGLGPHRRGVGCLYVKRLTDVDAAALARIVDRSVALSGPSDGGAA